MDIQALAAQANAGHLETLVKVQEALERDDNPSATVALLSGMAMQQVLTNAILGEILAETKKANAVPAFIPARGKW